MVEAESEMAIYAFYAVANNIVLISALFGLRKRAPDLPRPFRTWAYPFAPLAVLVISVALVAGFIVSDPRDSTYALILLAASYPIYRLIKTKPVEQQTRIKKNETDRRLFFD
jgi:basic amino acid/polyamine antiporter, APA family